MLNQLESLAQLKSRTPHQRQRVAETRYQKGLSLLELAHQEGYTHPLRLQEASKFLIQAIQHNRRDLRPLLAMAYLFLILEDHDMALSYVTQALNLEPEHAEALNFQARILADRERISQRAGQRSTRLSDTHDALDYDQLYDECENFIREAVREVMLTPPPVPVLADADVQKLRDMQARLEEEREQIRQQLKVIDEEIDIAELSQMLRPLEINHKRYTQVLELSQQLQRFHGSLRAELELLSQVVQEAQSSEDPADLEILIENQDALLENLDDFMRQSESFQQQGALLPELQQTLTQLQDDIERFQDVLEETEVRLSSPQNRRPQ